MALQPHSYRIRFRSRHTKHTIHPVVERRGSLGEFKVQLIDGDHDLLGFLQGRSSLGGQSAETIPLLADFGASRVDFADEFVVEGVQLLSDRGDLLNSAKMLDEGDGKCWMREMEVWMSISKCLFLFLLVFLGLF